MIKVLFWDKTFVFVEDEFKSAIEQKMGNVTKFRLKHLGGQDVVMGNSIARVTQARYMEYQHMLPKPLGIEAPKKPELTEEQLAERRAKIDKMKQDFLNRKSLKPKEANREQKKNEPGVR